MKPFSDSAAHRRHFGPRQHIGADTLPGPSSVIDDDDYDEEYDEPNGGNSLLGFMFGNVDNSGNLDADFLDKDAKEHLFALVDQLGPSLTEIELSKASPATMDTSEQGRLQTSRPLVHVLRKLQQTMNLIIG